MIVDPIINYFHTLVHLVSNPVNLGILFGSVLLGIIFLVALSLMVVEFTRFALQDEKANSSEFDEKTPLPVIDLMPDQKTITDKGGTMRLGFEILLRYGEPLLE